MLAVEVSATSLYTGLKIKAGLYVRAGIPEYWALDVESRRLFVHRYPENGKWLSRILRRHSPQLLEQSRHSGVHVPRRLVLQRQIALVPRVRQQ